MRQQVGQGLGEAHLAMVNVVGLQAACVHTRTRSSVLQAAERAGKTQSDSRQLQQLEQ